MTQPLQLVSQFEALPHDWDGYGSPPPTPSAIAQAKHILSTHAALFPSDPYIAPITGGGLQLEWQTAHRELELEILADGTMAYLKIDEFNEMSEGDFSLHIDATVDDLLRWLV